MFARKKGEFSYLLKAFLWKGNVRNGKWWELIDIFRTFTFLLLNGGYFRSQNVAKFLFHVLIYSSTSFAKFRIYEISYFAEVRHFLLTF